MNNPESDKTQLSAPSMHTSLGLPTDRIGPYKLVKFLGEGGMGRVYLAEHAGLRRLIALKVLPQDLATKANWVQNFNAEAIRQAKLRHKHVVEVHDYIADEKAGLYCIAFEYVDGGDLEKRRRAARRGMEEADVVRILDQTLLALEYAHGTHLVHRDLKPANILLTTDGTVKVSDFGLAAVVGEDHFRSLVEKSITLSQMGNAPTVAAGAGGMGAMSTAIGGTLPFMPPEAKRGEGVDARDDIYAIGVITYCLLTGNDELLPNRAPVWRERPGLAKGWEQFIARCAAPTRAERYQSAREAHAALHRLTRKKGSGGLWLGLVALLAVLGGGGYFALQSMNPSATGAGGHTGPATSVGTASLQHQGITFPAPAGEVGIEHSIELGATATSGLPVSYRVTEGQARISPDNRFLIATAPGRVVVVASQEGNGSYAPAAEVAQTFQAVAELAKPVAQAIEFPPLPEFIKTNSSPVPVHVTSSSGLAVSVEVVSGPGRLDGQMLSPTGDTGTIVVRATQAGNARFLPAASVDRSIEVKPAFDPEKIINLPGGSAIKLELVPAGTARLGPAGPAEVGVNFNDTPVVDSYRVTRPFYMAATEVTQTQFAAVMGRNPSLNNRFAPDNHPAEQIDFEMANTFIDKLNAILTKQGVTDYVAALPDDREWEYACRAGSTTSLYNGRNLTNTGSNDPVLKDLAVYGSAKVPGVVASKAPNPWGLFDMLGNVAEWTSDGSLRGGSYRDAAASCRASARLRDAKRRKDDNGQFGIRVILRPAP